MGPPCGRWPVAGGGGWWGRVVGSEPPGGSRSVSGAPLAIVTHPAQLRQQHTVSHRRVEVVATHTLRYSSGVDGDTGCGIRDSQDIQDIQLDRRAP
eukprot:COSAG01_NODE_1090_length_11748_cov_58.142244_11_plen_96_part_00